MCINELLDDSQLLLRRCSNLVFKYNLLERDEWELWVVLGGEEMSVLLNGGGIGRTIKPPCFA